MKYWVKNTLISLVSHFLNVAIRKLKITFTLQLHPHYISTKCNDVDPFPLQASKSGQFHILQQTTQKGIPAISLSINYSYQFSFHEIQLEPSFNQNSSPAFFDAFVTLSHVLPLITTSSAFILLKTSNIIVYQDFKCNSLVPKLIIHIIPFNQNRSYIK